MKVAVPPVDDQRRIGQLQAIHELLDSQLTALIDAKRRFKRGLMQQLLTGKRRFKEFGEEWVPHPMGDLLTESRVSSSDGRHARRLTIRLYGKGVVASASRRPGSANTKYYRRSAGQFIYSKLDFLNGACGIVPEELDGYETTLDLPAFDVADEVDVGWLVRLATQPWFYLRQIGLTKGGRKAKRLNPQALSKIYIRLPPKAEQAAIADFADCLEREIRYLERLRDVLDRQRRGVMELLLTGKVRVPA